MTKTVRILSIDSGGTFGLLPLIVLEYLEKKIGKPIAECFHIIAGTSTGAIIGAGLCRPMGSLSATELKHEYRKDIPKIFHRTLWRRISSMDGTLDERFSHKNLEAILKKRFGSFKLSDINRTHFMACSYEIEQRLPILFRSWKAQGLILKPEKGETQKNQDFLLRDVLRAASAAPTIFEPAKIKNMAGDTRRLIDGGVYASSPVRMAITQARKLYPNASKFLILSLSCGDLKKPICYDRAINWGSAAWLLPFIDILLYAQPQVIDYDLEQEMPEDSYYRFTTSVNDIPTTLSHPAWFSGNTEILDKISDKGDALVQLERQRLDELVEKLKPPRGKLGESF